MACVKVIFLYSIGGAEENHRKSREVPPAGNSAFKSISSGL